MTQVTSLWDVHQGPSVSLHTLRTTEEAHLLMSTRWRSSSRRPKRCPGDLTIEASCPSLAQLEMPPRMLIQTAVKQLPGHGKTLTVPEKTANGCNNFPQLIKFKHFFPQLRGRKGAGADWQAVWGQNMALIKIAPKEATHEDIRGLCCPVLSEVGCDSNLPRPCPVGSCCLSC